MEKLQYCNWTFWEVITKSNKWGIQRDCDDKPLISLDGYGLLHESVTAILLRGYSRNWLAYKAALEPHGTGEPPSLHSKCPKCGKYVNGVNPYDDGETWRK